jgi:hypothetical protein
MAANLNREKTGNFILKRRKRFRSDPYGKKNEMMMAQSRI